jgi:two-component system sensor histidine kinase GlrK
VAPRQSVSAEISNIKGLAAQRDARVVSIGPLILFSTKSGDAWVLDVRDNGPGVSPGDRDRIFEPFYQGHTPQGGLVRGTGIGLSVVRDFVAAHGGTVELVAGDHEGAWFRLRLPQRQAVGKPYSPPVSGAAVTV